MRLSRKSKSAAAPEITEITRFLRRATTEPDVRGEGRVALRSLKSAYGRFERAKSPANALLDDRKLHRDLRRALKAIRRAAVALTAPPKMRTRDNVALAGMAAALLIAAAFVLVRGRKNPADEGDAAAETEAPQSPEDIVAPAAPAPVAPS